MYGYICYNDFRSAKKYKCFVINVINKVFFFCYKIFCSKIISFFIMNLNLALNEFYFYSKHYLSLLILQILLSVALVVYVLHDFKTNINDVRVFTVEIALAFLMVLDIFLYSYISKCSINIFVVMDWILIVFYSVVLFMLFYTDKKLFEEKIEFGLLIGRMVFVIVRCIFVVIKLFRRE